MKNQILNELIEKFNALVTESDKKKIRTEIEIFCRQNDIENPLIDNVENVTKKDFDYFLSKELNLQSKFETMKRLYTKTQEEELLAELQSLQQKLAGVYKEAMDFGFLPKGEIKILPLQKDLKPNPNKLTSKDLEYLKTTYHLFPEA
jgi:hypothetical protein